MECCRSPSQRNGWETGQCEVTAAQDRSRVKARRPNGRSRKTGVDSRSTIFSKEELITDLQRSGFLGIDNDVVIPSPNSPPILPFSDPPGDSPFELLDHILELPSSF